MSVKMFLANYNIPVFDHPPYSLDLPPDLFVPKVKSVLKAQDFSQLKHERKRGTRHRRRRCIEERCKFKEIIIEYV